MDKILEFAQNTEFIGVMMIILLLVVVIETILIIVMNRRYISFMKKMGNGNNLDELLKNYINDVKEIKKDNSEIKNYYIKLDSDLAACVQKVGLVRYNAFNDVGSDLSFAIAILDGNDDGVVLNGIYGSESSNIYAKPIKNKKSTYKLSDEEEYAIDIAEQNKNFMTRKRK